MKALLLTLAILGTTNTVYAALPLVEQVTYHGFGPVSGTQKLMVLEDGSVKVFTDYTDMETGNPIKKTFSIAKLSKESINAIRTHIKTIEHGPLVDSNAGEPECMDAPGISIFVTQKSKKFEIYSLSGCHDHFNQSYGTSSVVEIIKGLAVLANSID